MNRVLPIIHVLGLVVLIFAFALLVPVAAALYFDDAAQTAYDEAFVITFMSGLLMWLATQHKKRELQIKDGFLLVALVWAGLPAFATLPFLIYFPDLSFTDAYFEAVSGMTTTGSTIFTGLDAMPPSINLWRAELVWVGGMGLIVLAVAVLPLLGIGGRQMFKAETPGPMKDSQLTPRIAQTAKGLWLVYAGITLACFLAYWAAGMSKFDALVHSFTTMGLGGFSTHDASFGYFNSPLIEMVCVVFMLIAGVNFATHFLAFRSRSVRAYSADSEAHAFWIVTLGSVLIIAVYLWWWKVYPDILTALRHSLFNTVSIATSTGYASIDYNLWPIFAPLLMLLLSCFASSSGSTGGGIKMVRAMLLFKQGLREMARLIHPNAILPVKLQGMVVPNNIIYAVLAYLFLYLVSVVLMTLLMTASGLDFLTSFTAIIASINNTGPGLNLVGPATTYAILTDFQTWVCSFAMLLGRLELFTFFVILTRTFWRS